MTRTVAHRPGALHDELGAFQQEGHRLCDLVLFDRDGVVDESLHDRQRERPGAVSPRCRRRASSGHPRTPAVRRHRRSVGLGRAHLRDRGVPGHEDVARHLHSACADSERDRLRVVPGRRRDDPSLRSVPEGSDLRRHATHLNEPVRYRFSAFIATVAPARSESWFAPEAREPQSRAPQLAEMRDELLSARRRRSNRHAPGDKCGRHTGIPRAASRGRATGRVPACGAKEGCEEEEREAGAYHDQAGSHHCDLLDDGEEDPPRQEGAGEGARDDDPFRECVVPPQRSPRGGASFLITRYDLAAR